MNKTVLTLLLCGATALGTAQMMPNPGQNPTMPGQQVPGQPGRPGTMGGEIPDSTQTTGQNNPNATNAPAVPKVDDATLERDVKQQLASDPAFAMVQVAAKGGRVELTGSVPSKDDRKKAKDMVKSVPGVTSVKEHIAVGGGASPSGMAAGSPSSSPDQNTAGSISGNSGTPANGNSSVPEGSAQPTPQNSPQQSAPQSNPQANPQAPDTTPHAGNTTPAGSGVRLLNASYRESGKPQEAAPPKQNSPSSSDQTNSTGSNAPLNITLTPSSSGDNATLQSQIENAIHNDPSLSASHVAVNVTDSTVDLSGTVASTKDKVSAERIAQSFGTNRKMNDKLTVTGKTTAGN